MNNYQKIEELLSQSTLSIEQSDELLILFQRSDDRELLPVVEILTQDISWAERIYKNYSVKIAAVENKDKIALNAIFENEAELLQDLK